MKKLKENHSFEKQNISILNIHFSEEEKTNNNGIVKKKLLNPKMIKMKINSSKTKSNINAIFEISPKVSHSQLAIRSNLNKTELSNNKDNTDINIIKNLTNKSSKKRMNKNLELNIKKTNLEFNESDYIDKSCENWEEVRQNYIQHMNNEKILQKYDNEKINKKYFNAHRKFYFGLQKVYELPYVYDISSTYMNNYHNRSEHKRHELLIDELCRLRAYLTKYPNNNNIDIIKDFLIKYNIKNIDKYSNYQLLQLRKFVCQEDIYKINSLLKPYLHVKDMIYDILENSVILNNKFGGYKFNSLIDKKLNQIYLEKNNENKNVNKSCEILNKKNANNYKDKDKDNNNYINQKKQNFVDNVKKGIKKNKKFYISELDTGFSACNNNDLNINSSNRIDEEELEKCDEIKTKNHNEFIKYSKKRKELLDSIGLFINTKRYKNNDTKEELYCSPLIKKKKRIYQKYKNNNNFQLPRINNKAVFYYKPNKLLLAPDKNYSSNFNLLLKDTINELKDFENSYKEKLDMIGRRNLSQYNNDNNNTTKNIKNINKPLNHSQSCKNFDNKDIDRIKKLEAINRLYYGKKTIKIELKDIQKKNKLTEYIALVNAKKHIKDEIINDNVIK